MAVELFNKLPQGHNRELQSEAVIENDSYLPPANGNDATFFFEPNLLNDAIKNRCQSDGICLCPLVVAVPSVTCSGDWEQDPRLDVATGCTVFPAKTVCSDWCSQQLSDQGSKPQPRTSTSLAKTYHVYCCKISWNLGTNFGFFIDRLFMSLS